VFSDGSSKSFIIARYTRYVTCFYACVDILKPLLVFLGGSTWFTNLGDTKRWLTML